MACCESIDNKRGRKAFQRRAVPKVVLRLLEEDYGLGIPNEDKM